jgi:hypothetical protein
MSLDLIGIGTGVLYIAAIVASFIVSGRPGRTTYWRLTWGLRLCWLAIALAVIRFIIGVVEIRSAGIFMPLLWLAIVFSALVTTYFVRKRRDLYLVVEDDEFAEYFGRDGGR